MMMYVRHSDANCSSCMGSGVRAARQQRLHLNYYKVQKRKPERKKIVCNKQLNMNQDLAYCRF